MYIKILKRNIISVSKRLCSTTAANFSLLSMNYGIVLTSIGIFLSGVGGVTYLVNLQNEPLKVEVKALKESLTTDIKSLKETVDLKFNIVDGRFTLLESHIESLKESSKKGTDSLKETVDLKFKIHTVKLEEIKKLLVDQNNSRRTKHDDKPE